jgi:hypothetical protein
MLSELKPDKVVLFNGRLAPLRVFLEISKSKGLDVICHERGFSKESLLLWKNEHCLSLDVYHQLNKYWSDVHLTNEQVQNVSKWLVDRQKGQNLSWTAFSIDHEINSPTVNDFIRKYSNLWVLFTSSTDEAASAFKSCFLTQEHWILKTIDFLRDKNVGLIIRIHPNTGSAKSIGRNTSELNFYETLAKNLPNNILLINADDNTSSYSLMKVSKLGLTFSSTAGLEMSALGKLVLQVAESPYMFSPSIRFIQAQDEYFKKLDEVLTKNLSYTEALQIMQNAFRFIYAMIFRWQIKFPLIEMPNQFSGILKVKTLGELSYGANKELDRVVDIIIGKSPPVESPSDTDKTFTNPNESLNIINSFQSITGISPNISEKIP